MDNASLVFVGVILSLVISVVSPFIERKYPLDADLIKKGILIAVSIAAATIYYFYGDSVVKSFVMIIGSASSVYGILTKDSRLEKIVRDKFL